MNDFNHLEEPPRRVVIKAGLIVIGTALLVAFAGIAITWYTHN